MTGINHVLAGGIIGGAIAGPAAVPVAFASHFILDSLPHYGLPSHVPRIDDWVWKLDVIVLLTFSAYIYFLGFENKEWVIAASVAALSPDFVWVYRFAIKERFGRVPPTPKKTRFDRFHASIQKYELPRGVWIEGLVLLSLSVVFVRAVL